MRRGVPQVEHGEGEREVRPSASATTRRRRARILRSSDGSNAPQLAKAAALESLTERVSVCFPSLPRIDSLSPQATQDRVSVSSRVDAAHGGRAVPRLRQQVASHPAWKGEEEKEGAGATGGACKEVRPGGESRPRGGCARGRAGAGAEASRGGDAEGEGSRGSREASRAQTGGEQVGDGERRAEASKGVGRARKETHRREKRRRARLRSVRAGSGSIGIGIPPRQTVGGSRIPATALAASRAPTTARAKTTIRNTTGPPAGSPAALRSGTTWTRRGRRSLSERMRPRGGVRTCPNRGPRLRTEPERRTRTRRPREPRSRRRSTPRRSARLRRRRGEVAVGPPRGVSRRRSRGTARRAAPAPPSRPAFPSSAPTTPCARCRCGCSGAGWAARRTCALFWTT